MHIFIFFTWNKVRKLYSTFLLHKKIVLNFENKLLYCGWHYWLILPLQGESDKNEVFIFKPQENNRILQKLLWLIVNNIFVYKCHKWNSLNIQMKLYYEKSDVSVSIEKESPFQIV